jgi:hypothetical protein
MFCFVVSSILHFLAAALGSLFRQLFFPVPRGNRESIPYIRWLGSYWLLHDNAVLIALFQKMTMTSRLARLGDL